VRIPVQVGGGIRSLDTARTLLDEGADRVVIGTRAAEEPEAVSDWVSALGADQLIVSVDARDGRLATHGWATVTDLEAVVFCERLATLGVGRVIYTDVARDGLLGGPDIERTRAVARLVRVIGSGGVATLEHLRALADAGAEGAIIGTALYEARLKLKDVLLAVAC
jgi:phosphoribosylformimino-5-aminoimidazole carboxamide ribotide isomerase